MTTKPVSPPKPELLPSHPMEQADLRNIAQEIGGVLDFLAVVQAVDTDGVKPFDIADVKPYDGAKKAEQE